MIDKENLPKGWTVAKLGELVITEKGKKPKRVSKEKTEECSIPYVNIKAFEKNIIAEYTDGVGCVICEDDDFLIVWDGSRSGYVGKAIKGALGSTLVRIKLPLLNQDYVYYFLQSKFIEINTRAKGVGIPHVDPNLLWNYDFPIAPLPEQTRILTKLEQLLTDLDKGIEYLETTKQQLKIYRQAVLKWAFEGKLTNTKMVNKKVSEIALVNPKLPFEKIDDNTEVQFLPMKLVEEVINKINLTEIKKYKEVKKGFTPMTNGDVIFAKITPCMENGKIAVVHSLKNEIAFGSTEFHVFRTKENYLNTYLFHFLVQEKVRQEAERNMTGAVGQRRVPKKFLEDLEIPTCSFSIQQKIVQEIESRLSVCEKIEETIESSLQQAEALRLSIIKKAFEGKLVPQDPNDEPAEKLLERIRAAKGGKAALKGRSKLTKGVALRSRKTNEGSSPSKQEN